MIRKVLIENYKSIERLTLDLGRLNVFIGANGSGKSNILEAIALASATAQNKLDNEFLISRGIRVTETRFMQSAFGAERPADDAIKLSLSGDGDLSFACELRSDETSSYPKWQQKATSPGLMGAIAEFVDRLKARGIDEKAPRCVPRIHEAQAADGAPRQEPEPCVVHAPAGQSSHRGSTGPERSTGR